MTSNLPDFPPKDGQQTSAGPDRIPEFLMGGHHPSMYLLSELSYDDSYMGEASYTEPAENEWNKQHIDATIQSNIYADKEVEAASALRIAKNGDYKKIGLQEAARGQVSTTRRMIQRYADIEKATEQQVREAHRVRRMVFMHSAIDTTDPGNLQRIMGAFVRTGNNAYSWDELDIIAAKNLEQDRPEFIKKLTLSLPLCTQRIYDPSDIECARLWSIARITRLQICAYQELKMDTAQQNIA